LALHLTEAGFVVVRFDYHGTGDSAGSDTEVARLSAWLESIQDVADDIRIKSNLDRIAFVGLRLGATLCGKLAESFESSHLVFWNPCTSGKSYVREMQIVQSADHKRKSESVTRDGQNLDIAQSSIIDAGGFVISGETADQLQSLEFGSQPFVGTPEILLIESETLSPAQQVKDRLTSLGSSVTHIKTNDYGAMMLPPQFSELPTTSIRQICTWLTDKSPPILKSSSAKTDAKATRDTTTTSKITPNIHERVTRFGSDLRLFGVTTFPSNTSRPELPAVILLCGGSVHHVSANRMYVPFARSLAASGFTVLRMDLSGIGDSIPANKIDANKAYTQEMHNDVAAGMDHIAGQFGTKRFILFGLCSGAYAATHTAYSSNRIAELILVNQLVYYLQDEDFAFNSDRTADYQNSLDFPRRRGLFDRLIRKCVSMTSPAIGWPGRIFSARIIGGDLSADLRKLVARGIHLTFVHSRGDAACDALMLPAGKVVNALVVAGNSTRKEFDNTDHIFSDSQSQSAIQEWVTAHLKRRWKP